MIELWRTVPAFPMYEVSNRGQVRSVKPGTPRLLKPRTSGNGYPQAHFKVNGRRYYPDVHTLVLQAFVGPKPSPEHQGRHLNDVKTDNRPENLAWGTRKENAADRRRNGGYSNYCRATRSYKKANPAP